MWFARSTHFKTTVLGVAILGLFWNISFVDVFHNTTNLPCGFSCSVKYIFSSFITTDIFSKTLLAIIPAIFVFIMKDVFKRKVFTVLPESVFN